MRLSDVGEAGLIARLQRRLQIKSFAAKRGVVIGIGDDAAVLRALAPHAVVSADMLIEGVDFEWAWARPADVGHKAAAVNLSDLAAMGAQPRGLLASIALQRQMRVADVLNLLSRLHGVGQSYGAPLVGGDISSTTGPCVIAVTALGQASPRQILRRHGARPNDIIAVTGALGAAAAGLCQLQSGGARTPSLVRSQLRPAPRLALGRALAKAQVVRAAADISDGLIKDVACVLRPGVGAVLQPRAVPIARYVAQVARQQKLAPWQMALSGGEDFELVLAVAPALWRRTCAIAARHRVALTAVGWATKEPGICLDGAPAGAALKGFDHFQGR